MTATLVAVFAAASMIGGEEELSCSHSSIHEFVQMSSHISILDLSASLESEFCRQADICVPNVYISGPIVRAVSEVLFIDGRLRLDTPPGDIVTMTGGPNRASCAYVFDGYRNLVFWDDDEVLLAIPLHSGPDP